MQESFRRTLTIISKELLHIIRDMRTLMIVIILPVFLLILLSFAMVNDVEDMPLAVYDQSKSEESRLLINRYVSSGYFQVIAETHSEAETLGSVILK